MCPAKMHPGFLAAVKLKEGLAHSHKDPLATLIVAVLSTF